MSSIKTVAVLGAAGNVGKPIVKSLLDGNFTVTAVTRASSKSTFPDSIKVAKTDFSPDSLRAAFKGQDAVVCTTGFGGFTELAEIVKAAEAAGVKRFIPSEFGDLRDGRESHEAIQKALVPKTQAIDLLKSRAAENKDFTWTGLATGMFFDWQFFLPWRGFFRTSIKERSIEIVDSGNEPVYATNIAAIGKAVAGILKKPDETANKFLSIYSVKTTQNETLALLEELTGEKWNVTHISTKELLERGLEGVAKGEWTGFVDVLAAEHLEEGSGKGRIAPDGKYDNELLGVGVEDLKTVLEGVLEALKP